MLRLPIRIGQDASHHILLGKANGSKALLHYTLAIPRADEDRAQQECSCPGGGYEKCCIPFGRQSGSL